jgi:maltooligosyltrehalose trehalohydrolase
VIAELAQRVRAAAHPRKIILAAENEPQRAELMTPTAAGGFGLDAMWNDDFHHAARVALTGRHEGYYHDYRGHAQEFVSAVKRGFLYQGQYYHWQKKPRGTPIGTQPAWSLIAFTQNHDQVANTLYGERLHELTSPGRYRAMTALLLLAPQTPLLFMGQEFAAPQPFAFFADHRPDLATKVHAGRREFLSQFTTYATPSAQEKVPDPAAESTFLAAKLDLAEREDHASVYALHKDLLRVRREDPVIAAQAREMIDGAVLSAHAFVLRWFGGEQGDRLLLVNLGEELELHPAPEPLLAPPLDGEWQMIWSSDEPRYDGPGALHPSTEQGWLLPGESAVLLGAR